MFQTPSLLLTLLLLGIFALLLALALLRVRKLGEHSRQFAALATRQPADSPHYPQGKP